MSIMNFLAQIMSGNVEVDPEMKSQIARAMAGEEAPGAGAGRGFVNPPMVTAAQPARPAPVQTARPMPSQVPKDQEGFDSLITRIMAGGNPDELLAAQAPAAPAPMQAAMDMNPTDQRLAASTQQAPMAPPPGPGLLSRMGFEDGNQALGAFGAALAAAGSQDPAKTALAIQQQRSEEAKIGEARRQAMKPKFTPFGPGTVMVEHMGKVDFMPVEQAREFALKMEGVKATNAQDRQVAGILAGEEAKRRGATFEKATTEAGGVTTKAEYSPTVQRSVEKLDGLIAQIPAINTTTFPLGLGTTTNPLVAGTIDAASGAVGMGTEGFKVRRDLDKYYNEQVSADLKQLGANPTDTDLRFKQKPIPKAGDPIEYQIEYIKELRDRINEAENRRIGAAKKRDELSSSSATAPAPQAAPTPAAAGGVAAPRSKADFDAIPSGTRFKAPDGSIRVKP